MIDLCFGRILPESPISDLLPLSKIEWEVFASGRTAVGVLGELYQNCIVLTFTVIPTPLRPPKDSQPSK